MTRAAIALAVALTLVGSTPRSVPATTPRPVSEARDYVRVTARVQPSTSPGPTEAPPGDAAPRTRGVEPATKPDPAPEAAGGASFRSGVAAFAVPSFGSRYLAIPEGPGVAVVICASESRLCLQRTSTDAGPALFRQREGRVADLSYVDFAHLCRCRPERVGLIPVTIAYGPRATPPPTDVSAGTEEPNG